MIRIRDVMSREVITVSPELTLRELAEILSDAGVSGAPVVTEEGRLVGVVSATDLVEFDADRVGVPTEGQHRATWDLASPSEEWKEGDEPSATYFVDLWADAGADVLERFAADAGPEWNVLEEHTVSEIMSRPAHALPPEAELHEAARYMLDAGVHRILVVEKGRLGGILTAFDVLRAVAERKV